MNEIQRKIDRALELGATTEEVRKLAKPIYASLLPNVTEPVKGEYIPYGQEFDDAPPLPERLPTIDGTPIKKPDRPPPPGSAPSLPSARYEFTGTAITVEGSFGDFDIGTISIPKLPEKPEDSYTSPTAPVATDDTRETPPTDIPTPPPASSPRHAVRSETHRSVPPDAPTPPPAPRPVQEDREPNGHADIQLAGLPITTEPIPDDPYSFDWSDVAIAGAFKYNPIVATMDKIWAMDGGKTPIGSAFDDPDAIAGYPPELFINVTTAEERDNIKREYDRHYYANRILQESGGAGAIVSVAGGMTNPLYLIPYFRAMRPGFMKGVADAAAGEVITETAYHAGNLDRVRTAGESVFNVAAASVFGGILGKVASRGYVSPEEAEVIISNLQKELEEAASFIGPPAPEKPRITQKVTNLGTDVPDVPQMKVKGGFLHQLSPIRLLSSPVAEVRKLAALLGEQSVVSTTRHSIETLVKRFDRGLGKGISDSREIYRAYRDRVRREERLSQADFRAEVANALRNGDRHNIPEVQQAAQIFRREVLEPLRKEAVDVQLLSPDAHARFAESYFPRMYNFAKIETKRAEFVSMIANYIRKLDGASELSDEQVLTEARSVLRKIIGDPLSYVTHRDVKIKAGALKGKMVSISDNDLAPWLINDPEIVLRSWSKDLVTNVEFQRTFGDTSLKKVLQETEEAWDKYIEQVSKTEPEKALRLGNRKKSELQTLVALRDRLQGKYKIPDNPSSAWIRAGRAARNLNIVRLLGGMTLSAFPDMARPLYAHGFSRYAKAIHAVTNPSIRKLARMEMERMGIGLDMVLNSRLRAIAETDYMAIQYSRPEALLDNMVTGSGGKFPDFGRVSLMSPWNANLKMLTGLMSQDGLYRNLMKNQINMRKLKRAGITPEMAQRIKAELQTHGSEVGSLKFGNSDKWADVDAAEAFELAILREVDATIITPGIMDKPLWMSSETGKLIGQLKSFGFASTNKQLLAGLNNFDGYFIQGGLAAITLGALTWQLKSSLAGREIEHDPEELLLKGIEYSGAIGIGSEAIQFGAGMAQAMGMYKGDGNWRWARQGMWGSMLGPSAGLVEDGFRGLRTVFKEEPNAGDVEAFRRIFPYNNLFYMRELFDRAEDAEKLRLGIPP